MEPSVGGQTFSVLSAWSHSVGSDERENKLSLSLLLMFVGDKRKKPREALISWNAKAEHADVLRLLNSAISWAKLIQSLHDDMKRPATRKGRGPADG
jgi:hypothetical protein